ncbi:ATP-binding protein [Agromyces sp. NPDC060279]|uniref:ATP-binding protein n=1 Tax=Agromyces sp. NPDC060279 TaxID=3347092 RepID=UPI003658ED0A
MPSEPPRSRRIAARADPAMLERAARELAAFAAEERLADDELARLDLALGEVLANVVAHARPVGDAEGVAVDLTLSASPDAVLVTVEDRATVAAVDLAAVSMPAEDAESGRGLALALAVLNGFSHEEREGGGNRWTLRLRRRRG